MTIPLALTTGDPAGVGPELIARLLDELRGSTGDPLVVVSSREELAEWIPRIEAMKREAKQVTVLFNNNSRGDAAPNAKELIDLMGLRFEGLAPRQLGIW